MSFSSIPRRAWPTVRGGCGVAQAVPVDRACGGAFAGGALLRENSTEQLPCTQIHTNPRALRTAAGGHPVRVPQGPGMAHPQCCPTWNLRNVVLARTTVVGMML